MFLHKLVFSYCCLFLFFSSTVHASDKIVIAQNGAGQELLENSLPAITLAASQGVDTLELPVNLTADGELVLFKDLTLNRMSNVAEVFPLKNRADSGYYVIDFNLAEIQQMRVKNAFENDANGLSFCIPTFRETLSLIRHLESKLGHQIGISVEIVEPEFYTANGKDVSQLIIDTLVSFSYSGKAGDKVFLQSFSSDELQRIHNRILPDKQVVFPLIQLVKQSETGQKDTSASVNEIEMNHDWLLTNIGLRHTASYANAIALPQSLMFSPDGTPLLASYLESVRKYGLKIFLHHKDSPLSMPAYADTMQALLNYFYKHVKIDGLYTDDYLEVQKSNRAIEEEEKRRAELPEFFSNLNLSPPAPRENPASDTKPQDVLDY